MFVNREYVDDELVRLEGRRLKSQLLEQMYPADALAIELHARERARENVIERVLLRQAALQDAAPIPSDHLERALEGIRNTSPQQLSCMLPHDEKELCIQLDLDLRIERLLCKITADAERPKRQELVDYYQRFRDSFYTPDLVHAAHIVKNIDETTCESTAFDAITRIKHELDRGGNFEQLADEYSDCPANGGNLGTFPRGEMVEEFEDVVFRLGPGETSHIFRSSFGFHIARVYERCPARLRTLNEVRSQVEQSIWNERKQQAIVRFIADLRARAEIRKASAPAHTA